MYEDFTATDRWTTETLHCVWKGTVVAIATRHADATDIRFAVNDKPLWIAMPNLAWIEQKRRNGKVITDYLAAQAAGRFLKHAIESGYDNGREMYTMTIPEVLDHVAAVVAEVGHTANLPSLPVIDRDAHPAELDFKLPGEPHTAADLIQRMSPSQTRHRFLVSRAAFPFAIPGTVILVQFLQVPMFQHKVTVEFLSASTPPSLCPIKWLDNFAMRNFTNDAVFDDTLPLADGVLELGNRVPLDRLRTSMQDWFHRKGYLQKHEELRITPQ